MKFLVAFFVLFVACVYANRPCSAPHELTFRASRWNYGETYYERFFGEYDRFNKRVVLFEEDFESGTKKQRELLFLHKEGVGYDFNLQSKHCKKFKVGAFKPFEVPSGATYEGEFSIGGPTEEVTIDRWSDKISSRREHWIGEFSLKTCYPISQFMIEEGNFNKTSFTFFYDTVKGIVNPNDFNVPKECEKSAIEVDMPINARLAKAMYSGTLHD
ncbi:ependymin-related protein precursor [Aplysia californica]|uniref:Ependymin-related protein n=1 Tax=Aplysia californica TaxID=6500 RepID=A1XP46_APLCA|nr:ependymin-related protein precursor [Aplysia californica]ABF18970.1 ependymin-related protein [Aplysia californica]